MLRRRQMMQMASSPTPTVVTGWLYRFDGNILSSGTEDFGFAGTTEYDTGVNGQAYYHRSIDGGLSADTKGLKAVGLTRIPSMGTTTAGTISWWCKSVTANRGWMFSAQKTTGTSTSSYSQLANASNVKSGWSVSKSGIQKKFTGSRIGWESSKLMVRIVNTPKTYAANWTVTPPSGFDSTQWHHYALTAADEVLHFFIDGEQIFTVSQRITIGFSDQISIGGLFANSTNSTELQTTSYGNLFDDFYIAETCKWTSNFDPTTIVY